MKREAYLFLSLLIPVVGHSQAEKQLIPSDLKQLTVVTEPSTLNKGFFRTGMNISYGVMDKIFTTQGKRDFLTTNSWGTHSTLNLTFQYGITDRIQVDLSLPYNNTRIQGQYQMFAPAADTTLNGSINLKGMGVGDLSASLNYQIIAESSSKSSLTGHLYITIPTGEKNPTNLKGPLRYDFPTGNGNLATELKMTYRKIAYPFSYTINFGYEYSFKGKKIIQATDTKEKGFNDGDIIRTGGSFNFHLNEWIALTNDISFYHEGLNKVENVVPEGTYTPWAITYETHLVFQVKRFRLAEAILIPLIGKNLASADPQYIILAQYLF
jgi:hypothetical protein